jgi:hypothetical protein
MEHLERKTVKEREREKREKEEKEDVVQPSF